MVRTSNGSVRRNHADFLAAYTETLTPKGEAPERFNFWCGVSAIAGALRRRVYIDEGHFRFYPNFYIILVGPPGIVKKSTTIGISSRLLRDVSGVNLGADCATWQSFVEEVANSHDLFAAGDPDADLLEQEHIVTCAVTLAISEFGTFFDPDDRQMVNVLTELYDCKIDAAFRKRTKTKGEDAVMNPFVNIIAGTTPQWMRDNFHGQYGGWGLSSRCIFLHCDEPERDIAFPHKIWGTEYESTMKSFVHDLQHIASIQGPYQLSSDAERYAEQWYSHHRSRHTVLNRQPNHDPWLGYYFARKFDHMLKLSMVLAASRRDELVIDATDVFDAGRRCDEVELELSKVFRSRSSASRDSQLNMDVWDGVSNLILQAGGALELRQFNAFTLQRMDYGRANALLSHLISSDWLAKTQTQSGTFLSLGPNAKLSAEVKKLRGINDDASFRNQPPPRDGANGGVSS